MNMVRALKEGIFRSFRSFKPETKYIMNLSSIGIELPSCSQGPHWTNNKNVGPFDIKLREMSI